MSTMDASFIAKALPDTHYDEDDGEMIIAVCAEMMMAHMRLHSDDELTNTQ